MSSILLGMIHQRAMDSYAGPEITASNYDLWVKHWFETAKKIDVEFYDQGLIQTSMAVRQIIIEQSRYTNAIQRQSMESN